MNLRIGCHRQNGKWGIGLLSSLIFPFFFSTIVLFSLHYWKSAFFTVFLFTQVSQLSCTHTICLNNESTFIQKMGMIVLHLHDSDFYPSTLPGAKLTWSMSFSWLLEGYDATHKCRIMVLDTQCEKQMDNGPTKKEPVRIWSKSRKLTWWWMSTHPGWGTPAPCSLF